MADSGRSRGSYGDRDRGGGSRRDIRDDRGGGGGRDGADQRDGRSRRDRSLSRDRDGRGGHRGGRGDARSHRQKTRSRSPRRDDRGARDSPRQRTPPRGPRSGRPSSPRRNGGPEPGRPISKNGPSQPSARVLTGPKSTAKEDLRDEKASASPLPNGDAMDEDEDDDPDAQMKRLMGFGGFRSTKNTKVPGNDKLFAVRKEKKTEYRQYMNRVGGFNRPLSPSRQ